MASVKNTRQMLKVSAKNQIARLQELIEAIDDNTNDIVDISFIVDKVTHEEGDLSFIMDNCDYDS